MRTYFMCASFFLLTTVLAFDRAEREPSHDPGEGKTGDSRYHNRYLFLK
jgi:hypothetical protein